MQALFNHQRLVRQRADGTNREYEYETYRCYRKISSRNTCYGQTGYKAQLLNEAVENQIRIFLNRLQAVPQVDLVKVAGARNMDACKVAYKQAEKDFENIQRQVSALEAEAVKALTCESQLDLSVVNSMLVKHRAKLEAVQKTMEESKAKMESETANAKATKAEIDQLLSWAECFDKADIETRHMIIARIIERVEVRANRKIHIKFRISLDQFLGKSA